MQSDINCSIGNCYRQQFLYTEALEKYQNAIKIGEKSNGDISFIKAMNYTNIGSLYDGSRSRSDSSYYYYSKANYYSKHFSTSKRIGGKKNIRPVICASLGQYWKKYNRLDSANYYFLEGITLSIDAKNVMHQASLEFRIGELYLETNNYKKADYYLEKSKTTFEEKKDINTLPYVYSALSQLNKRVGNEKKYTQYQNEIITLNEKISKTDNDSRMHTVDNINKEKKEIFNQKEEKLYWIITAILLVSLVIFLLFLYYHKRMTRYKNNTISKSAQKLALTKRIIQEHEEESQLLKIKLNQSFDDIVQLAKNNSPEFFSRFQEIYPEFRNKLIQINPDLKITELTLCTYIYLGFNTKDIAEYTFKAEKTIRNNKYNLRKRLDVPAKADFIVWLRNRTDV